jgi:hypothetical protein
MDTRHPNRTRLWRAKELYSEPGRAGLLPLSKPTFFKNVREGFYPPGRLISPNVRAWTDDEVTEMSEGKPRAPAELAA